MQDNQKYKDKNSLIIRRYRLGRKPKIKEAADVIDGPDGKQGSEPHGNGGGEYHSHHTGAYAGKKCLHAGIFHEVFEERRNQQDNEKRRHHHAKGSEETA